MLYQLSHVRVAACRIARSPSNRRGTAERRVNAHWIARPSDRCVGLDHVRWSAGRKIDPEHEHTVLDRADGVTDDREVLEVVLRLLQEELALLARHRRKRATLHGRGAVPESGDHGVDVEGCSHGRHGTGTSAADESTSSTTSAGPGVFLHRAHQRVAVDLGVLTRHFVAPHVVALPRQRAETSTSEASDDCVLSWPAPRRPTRRFRLRAQHWRACRPARLLPPPRRPAPRRRATTVTPQGSVLAPARPARARPQVLARGATVSRAASAASSFRWARTSSSRWRCSIVSNRRQRRRPIISSGASDSGSGRVERQNHTVIPMSPMPSTASPPAINWMRRVLAVSLIDDDDCAGCTGGGVGRGGRGRDQCAGEREAARDHQEQADTGGPDHGGRVSRTHR